jgi:hypothetical protein
MPRKSHKPEKIIAKLRQSTPADCSPLGVWLILDHFRSRREPDVWRSRAASGYL